MFTSLKTFLGNQKPPMLYINPEGERFVVMGPDEYEHLTGESAESLQTIDAFDTIRNTNESLEDPLRRSVSVAREPRGPASSPESKAVIGGSHATVLAALRLEEEIGVDDLPL